MKSVVAASKCVPTTWTSGGEGKGDQSSSGAHNTISFKLKLRKDQEVTLPATSFPLESSSSEEETEDLDSEERERRALEKQQRREWRQMKREQFEKEKKDKKEKEDLDRHLDEKEKLKALEDQENASGDEDMYDIFKYG